MTQPISMPTPASAPADATKKSGTTIQPGVYDMKCTDGELGYTAGNAEKGEAPAPQLALLMEFVDGPYKGLSITWYGFFTEKTKASTIRALRTVGWTGDDLTDLSTARGRAPCTVQVEADLQGVLQARIRFIGGGAIAMKNIMNTDQKAAFAASMKAFASTIAADEPKPASGGAPGAPAAAAPGKFF